MEVTLPPDGIFNYVSVNIPAGVTVTFQKNAANTPVVWLVQDDVVIDGTIDISGQSNGQSGPGGFNGGMAGFPAVNPQGGLGPGGGESDSSRGRSCYGGGGGYSTQGGSGIVTIQSCNRNIGGVTYGRTEIIPLLGGSGGAGGGDDGSVAGSAGGGGGGAILIAASGTSTHNGTILADGGLAFDTEAGCGGGGAGGAVKFVATVIEGEGNINANPKTRICTSVHGGARNGGLGRIRFEAETLTRSSATSPDFRFGLPGPLFIPNFPQLAISEIGGISVPAIPTGLNDVVIPPTVANPMTVTFATTNVPLGSVVVLTIVPLTGEQSSISSGGITGTEESGTATVSASIPNGSSTLMASVTFTVDSMVANDYAPLLKDSSSLTCVPAMNLASVLSLPLSRKMARSFHGRLQLSVLTRRL